MDFLNGCSEKTKRDFYIMINSEFNNLYLKAWKNKNGDISDAPFNPSNTEYNYEKYTKDGIKIINATVSEICNNLCKEAIEKLNPEEVTQPEENLNYDELFSLSETVITDQTSTDTESSQIESQISQIPLKTPSKIQNTIKVSTSTKRKRGRGRRRKSISSKSPTNNNKSTSDSESSSDKSISSISYKTPNNKKAKIITETKSEPIKNRLRSYTKNHSLKSSPQSQSVTKPKTLYKPRNSSKPINNTTLLKRNKIKKRKEIRYINTTPLPVNDLSQSSSQQEEEVVEENKENNSEEKEVVVEEKEKEKDNNIIIDDEIIQNNKDNLLPQSPDTETDSPILQSITLPTTIVETSPTFKRPLDGINILKPKPKRVKTTLVSFDDVVVDKHLSDNNTSEDRIKSSLSDIFGLI